MKQLLLTLYLMVSIPTPTPVINPDVGLTDAKALLVLTQVPPATVEESVIVLPVHTALRPLKVPEEGIGVTFIVIEPVAAADTPLLVTVAV